MTKNFNNISLPEFQLLSKTRPAKLGRGNTRVMNLSWTPLSEDVFLSLGVKTLWKTKLWLIRAKWKKTHHGLNCATKSPEPHLAVAAWLLWSLLSSRIQLSSLQQSNPLKKNFTEHITYRLCDWTAINKHRYHTHRGFFSKDALWIRYCNQMRYLCLPTATLVQCVMHVMLSEVLVSVVMIHYSVVPP